MPYEYTVPADYVEEGIKEVIDESLASRLAFARRRLVASQACCATFERRYGMDTPAFLDKCESGALPRFYSCATSSLVGAKLVFALGGLGDH
jgi:hypothetical protein